MHSAGPPVKNNNKQALIVIGVILGFGAVCGGGYCCLGLTPMLVGGWLNHITATKSAAPAAPKAPDSPQEQAATRWLTDYRAAGTRPANTHLVFKHHDAEATMFTPGDRVSWQLSPHTGTTTRVALRGPQTDPRTVVAHLTLGPATSGHPVQEADLALAMHGELLEIDEAWPHYPVEGADPKEEPSKGRLSRSREVTMEALQHHINLELTRLEVTRAILGLPKADDGSLLKLAEFLRDDLEGFDIKASDYAFRCPAVLNQERKITAGLWASGQATQQCALTLKGPRTPPIKGKGRPAAPTMITFEIESNLVFKLNKQQTIDVHTTLGNYTITEG